MKNILLTLTLTLACCTPCRAGHVTPPDTPGRSVCAARGAGQPFAFSLKNPSRTRIIQISVGCMALGLFIMLRK